MQLYTKTGDKGQTSLIGGRVDKDNSRVEAYGTVDEVNSFVGQAITQLQESRATFEDIIEELEKIQHELFDCGGDLANVTKKRQYKLQAEAVSFLEDRIDAYVEEAPPLEKFILPGGSAPSATLHIARTITRRAERTVVSLVKMEEDVPAVAQQYLNRLSDYFFAIARVVNARLKINDVEYIRSANVFSGGKKKEKKDDK
ncbi:cob(I)yrinic acid a,c-diamide adenosyltransferase [Bacillus seohaeanensis]|jgi:cob(I)alamin adenosyltransferase|uniref:Corrinoid adenosyltransferase n=1 Tax=Bacillus seohaeanensis TaxID=284580 RepID=A0ABW5RTY7_9BACI